jgi:hypothetical protein
MNTPRPTTTTGSDVNTDPLADRVAEWVSQPKGEQSLRGWALLETLKRRNAASDGRLIEKIENRLPKFPHDEVTGYIDAALQAWNGLLADLDREEENFEHVRRTTRDVFFSVLEALTLAEDTGGDAEEAAAKRLFNAVANELYAFEPMADVAAELERRGQGDMTLSDLLCVGVARMFDGHPRVHEAATTDAVEVDDFVSVASILGDAPLTPAKLAKRLARVEWWYVKWAAQRLQVSVMEKTRDLIAYVWSGDAATLAMSKEMDGWEIRAGSGRDLATATIKGGTATIKLPARVETRGFVMQVKAPGAEWSDVFARVGER